MAKNFGVLVCILIMILDIVAGILGIEAEISQNKVKHLKMLIFECRDPSYTAYKLGLAAAILLALAHTIANVIGGCVCVWSKEDYKKSTANKQLAVGCLIFSWIILAVGLSMLILGTMANRRSRKSCAIAHRHLLSIGGILCFLHGMISVAYYVSATATAREKGKAKHPTTGP